MKDKTIEKAKLLIQKDKLDLTKIHIHTWMLYLEKAAVLVEQERIYDNFEKTNGR